MVVLLGIKCYAQRPTTGAARRRADLICPQCLGPSRGNPRLHVPSRRHSAWDRAAVGVKGVHGATVSARIRPECEASTHSDGTFSSLLGYRTIGRCTRLIVCSVFIFRGPSPSSLSGHDRRREVSLSVSSGPVSQVTAIHRPLASSSVWLTPKLYSVVS
jgi:hypothetical protein